MATFNRERVAHALNELLARIVPDDPNEDEQQADERFGEAYSGALDELENAGPLPVVPDIHHVAELIDTRLSADEEGAQKSARFNNLFSRLVSQPVLDQKWGMLYFLLELSDMASPHRTV
jgi:gamma-tubulin complex component 3